MIRITKQNIINHIDRDPETETNTVEEKIIKELIKQKKWEKDTQATPKAHHPVLPRVQAHRVHHQTLDLKAVQSK